MDWLFIGTLLGSLVTSSHVNKEACEGRAVILKEKGVVGKCVDNNQYITSGTIQFCSLGNACYSK